MNKQEAIEEIKKQSTQAYDDFAIMRDTAIHIINQIDEPQKVVVPQFVAEWIGYCRSFDNGFLKCLGAEEADANEVDLWIKENPTKLVSAWLDGFEIEKEKLYTVEIPDPNSMYKHRFLSRRGNGVCIDASNYNDWKQRRENNLTESEIKQDFEWAWRWAKEVEETDE